MPSVNQLDGHLCVLGNFCQCLQTKCGQNLNEQLKFGVFSDKILILGLLFMEYLNDYKKRVIRHGDISNPSTYL